MLFNKKQILLKSLVVVIICIFMLNIVLIEAEASKYDDYAEKLSEINVFLGTGDGFDLDRQPTRLEGLVMLIRLLGAEKNTESYVDKPIIFDDVPNWGKRYVSYAYNNGITKGISKTEFGSNNVMDSKTYMTFLLRALGYNDSEGDFSWKEANEYAKEVGLIDENTYFELTSSEFLRDHVAKTSYNALFTNVKEETYTLINKLVNMGAIESDVAERLSKNNEVEIENSNTHEELLEASLMISAYSNEELIGQSSGFYFGKDISYIITNYDPLVGADNLEVKNYSNEIYDDDVYVLAYDIDNDIIILSIDYSSEDTFMLDDIEEISDGDEVLLITSSDGVKNTVSNKIINGFQDDLIVLKEDKDINGGLLLNLQGKAIGIVPTTHNQDLHGDFAVDINKIDLTYLDKAEKLSIFFNQEAELKAPGEIKLVDKDSKNASFRWDNVEDAEYYHFYFKESQEDKYWYYVNEDVQEKYYYSDSYMAALTNLNPNTTYNVFATSVRNELESVPSPVLTFKTEGTSSPTGLEGLGLSNSEVVLYWDEMSNADYYHVYFEDSNGDIYPILNTNDEPLRYQWNEYGNMIFYLNRGTNYTFYVTAVIDGIETELSNSITVATLNKLDPMKLYSSDGTYLGELSTNKFDSDSIFNEYGTYGSKYSSDSIWNEYGTYGSKYSNKSAFNDYASDPPMIYSGDQYVGRLTTNKYKSDAVSPIGLYDTLLNLGY
jgi:hypothetical protein